MKAPGPDQECLRIGVDIRLPDAPSGQQRYLWRLGHWLAARGHDARLLCTVHPPEGGAGRADVPDHGSTAARVHDLSGRSGGELAREVRALELDVLLLNPERSRHYDGVRANVLRPGYGTDHFSQKLRSVRNPFSRVVRRLLRETPPVRRRRRIEREFYQGLQSPSADPVQPEVLAISDYMEGEVRDAYPVDPDRIHVIPNGVDVEAFSPARREELRAGARAEFGIPDDAVCVLTVAHNYRLKGVRQAMGHVARLRAAGVNAHLLVAGRGTGRAQRAQAHRWARSLDVEDAAHLPGVVRPVMRAFAAADVFLHLSWHDAFGFVVLEAMAAGLPPLTTPWAGASMLVEEGRSGLLVDPDDGESVHRALQDLMEPAARRDMGRRAREIAEAHSEEVNFRRVEAVCREAARRWPGPVH